MIDTTSKLRVLDIVAGTSVDGPGLRTSIYFAGCGHHCPGCHNPESWDPSGGREMSIAEIVERVNFEDFNVTFSGGDPLYQIEPLIQLAIILKASGRNIWCYTGYTIEQVLQNPKLREILNHIDVLVDGRFEEPLRDTSLRFRGSSNQRIIDVTNSDYLISRLTKLQLIFKNSRIELALSSVSSHSASGFESEVIPPPE